MAKSSASGMTGGHKLLDEDGLSRAGRGGLRPSDTFEQHQILIASISFKYGLLQRRRIRASG